MSDLVRERLNQVNEKHTSGSNFSMAMKQGSNMAAEPERLDRRETILSEAVRLFNENGYSDTRLEDIGARLGTAKTSISYHFKSKDGLLLEVYDRALTFSEAALNRADQEASGRGAIISWVRAHARAHADAVAGLAAPLALIADLPGSEGGAETELAARYGALLGACRHLFERGLSDGSIKVSSSEAALFFLLNLVHWLPRWLAEVRPADHDRAIDGLCDVLVHGIAADRSRQPARQINSAPETDSEAIFDRDARNRLKREALLRAGTRALNAHGYRSLSLADVAGELGVTRGAFYYHIADKDTLLHGCFERTCTLIATAQSLADKPDLSGLEILERALRWLFERQISNLDPLLRPGLLSALDTKNRLLINARLNRLKSGFADMIARGMIDGSVRSVELAAAEQLALGSVFAGSHRRKALLRRLSSAQAGTDNISSSAYYEVLIYGLRGRTV
jgi:AcrR family transcriptional regulator